MSAYMVSRNHIGFLVAAAVRDERFRYRFDGEIRRVSGSNTDQLTAIGQMLFDENRRSIEARYPDTLEDFAANAPRDGDDDDFTYEHSRELFWQFKPLQIIQSVACYQYQACEHDGWGESEAKAFTDDLRLEATSALIRTDGSLVWGAPDPQAGILISSLMS